MYKIVLFPSWFIRAGDATSQLVNSVLFNGKPNESISGRAARVVVFERRDSKLWKTLYWGINGLFFWQQNHCVVAYVSDNLRAKSRVAMAAGYHDVDWTFDEKSQKKLSH